MWSTIVRRIRYNIVENDECIIVFVYLFLSFNIKQYKECVIIIMEEILVANVRPNRLIKTIPIFQIVTGCYYKLQIWWNLLLTINSQFNSFFWLYNTNHCYS